jgi:hypothetical protein
MSILVPLGCAGHPHQSQNIAYPIDNRDHRGFVIDYGLSRSLSNNFLHVADGKCFLRWDSVKQRDCAAAARSTT